MQILLLVPVMVGIIAIKKYGFGTHTFYLMFIMSVCGLGFYYNNQFRMGFIFPSDLYLAAFVVVWIFQSRGILVCNRSTATTLFIITLFQITQGLFLQYDIGEILTDFKYVLYFFVPYFYGKTICYDKSKSTSVFVVYVVAIVVTLILNWSNFLSNGISALIYFGEKRIIRTFAIGLGFSCGALVTCLLILYKEEFIRKTNVVLYYAIQVILIASCIASYTRTNWISYGITVVLLILFVKEKKIDKSDANYVIKAIINIGVIALILVVIYQLLNKYFLGFTETIFSRFNSIGDSMRLSANVEANTFEARINDVFAGADVFVSPRILWGYGYGALYTNASGYSYGGLENSYIYYLWKYGIPCGLYLFYRVINKLQRLWKYGERANKAIVIFALAQLIVGSLSGHYNSAYSLAVISIIMEMNLDLVFMESEEIKQ